MPGKPRTVVCYICGREFGTQSLQIHERQCIQKWHIENNKLPKHQRRPAPQKPQGLPALGGGKGSVEQFNEAAYRSAQGQLLPCQHCGRTFATDRLEVHQRSCKASNPSRPLKNGYPQQQGSTPRPGSSRGMEGEGASRPGTATIDTPKVLKPSMIDVGSNPTPRTNRGAQTSSHTKLVNGRPKTPGSPSRQGTFTSVKRPLNLVEGGVYSPTTPPKAPKRKPQFVVCYICGREFTLASLPIHEPQCLEKWKVENAKLPKEMRRPVPKKPVVYNQPIAGNKKGQYNVDAMNAAAYEASKANLVPCDLCGRTFAQDRITTHQRICVKVGGGKSAGTTRPGTGGAGAAGPGTSGGGAAGPGASRGGAGGPGASGPLTSRPKMGDTAPTRQSTQGGQSPPKPAKTPTPARTPKFVFCYICGRQFTDASLPIHEPQCLQKWEVENKRLPKELRKPRPKKPEALASGKTMTREQMQEVQYEASKANLVECPTCGRTFNPDRIVTHQRICTKTGGKGAGPGNQANGPSNQPGGPGNQRNGGGSPTKGQANGHDVPAPKTQAVKKPVFVICHICGRQFGSKSIAIHEPQCLEKWRKENDKQPAHLRRPEPQKPQAVSGGGSYSLDAQNEAAWQASQANLAPCPNCGRTFQPDRLQVHLRSCRPKPPKYEDCV